jgi:GTPase
LTRADVVVADKLFATLDPTTRRTTLPSGNIVLLTDTVGFIQKLPTQLIASFRATLEEITDADLLLHIIDYSHPAAFSQWRAVKETLEIIHADHIPSIDVLNKMDIHQNRYDIPEFSDGIRISALTGVGLPELLILIENELFESFESINVKLPYSKGNLISIYHKSGRIEKIEQGVSDVTIKGSLPGRFISDFLPFKIKK